MAQSAPKAPARTSTTPSDTATAKTEQWISLGFSSARYTIGDSAVKEGTGNFSYDLRTGRFHFAVDGSSVNYSTPSRTISGMVPTSLTLDMMVHNGDTLTLLGRTGSQPANLDSAQLVAIGVSGGTLLDMQSINFGTQAMTGAHGTLTFPMGDVVLNLRGGIEIEPRPSALTRAYWRGTTMLGGATLTGKTAKGDWSGVVDYSTSTADSLGGRNLYPGGGDFTAQFNLHAPLDNPAVAGGEDWDTRWSANLYIPISASRTDQPNRLVPVGPMYWFTGALTVPIGEGSVGASASYSGASSSAQRALASASSSSWATSVALNGSIPIAKGIELVPEIGTVAGSSDVSLGVAGVRRPGRPLGPGGSRTTSIASGVSGSWMSLSLTFTF
ncbi:MAG: hypothetical protein NTZ43_08505 [Gemmatimonadetes bacterium]|nr:hypothetical protein [Gemmatimonadota bacterium]